jgi:FlaA1/EpsC-like NDP-sugar epimerase
VVLGRSPSHRDSLAKYSFDFDFERELRAPIMRRLRNSPLVLEAADSLMALSLAVCAVVWVKGRDVPASGLIEFVLIRLTLLNASFSIVFAVLWKQCLSALGLYRHDLESLRGLVLRTSAACAIMTALLFAYLQGRDAHGPASQILLSFFVTAFFYELCRVMICNHDWSWHAGRPKRVIIVGSGRQASKAWRELRLKQHATTQVLGFVDDRDATSMAPDIADRLLCRVDELQSYLLENSIDEVVLATPLRSCYDAAQRAVSIAEAEGIRVVCLNDLFTLEARKHGRWQGLVFVELVPRGRKRPLLAATAPSMMKRFRAVS